MGVDRVLRRLLSSVRGYRWVRSFVFMALIQRMDLEEVKSLCVGCVPSFLACSRQSPLSSSLLSLGGAGGRCRMICPGIYIKESQGSLSLSTTWWISHSSFSACARCQSSLSSGRSSHHHSASGARPAQASSSSASLVLLPR